VTGLARLGYWNVSTGRRRRLMSPILLALALMGQATDAAQTADRARDTTRSTAMGPMVDGSWTVVTMEWAGQPISQGTQGTVTIRNNVLSYSGGAGGTGATDRTGTSTEAGAGTRGRTGADTTGRGTTSGQAFAHGIQKSCRLDFLPFGRVRATPADSTGRPGIGTTGQSSSAGGQDTSRDTRAGRVDQRGAGAAGRDVGAGHHAHSGVYVLSTDYLCLTLWSGDYYGRSGRGGAFGTGGNQGGLNRSGAGSQGTDRTGQGGAGQQGTDRNSQDTTGALSRASQPYATAGQQQQFVLILRKQGSGSAPSSNR
jgi:hypothetical protein